MGDLGAIARGIGDEYLRTHRTTPFQRKALCDIQRCRTREMGSVYATCGKCGAEHLRFRSCQNRSCPRCQAEARDAWLDARQQELLPVPYFHVVFTVPEALHGIALYCPELFYAELLRAAGKALLDVGKVKLHVQLGCMAVLHTWGQAMWMHPHAHCVVPGGGFSEDGTSWISVRNGSFLLPVKVLRSRFRTLLCRALRTAERHGRLGRVPPETPAREAIRKAAKQRWIVYAKAPFGGPEQVLEYVSRYTHRIAISNGRIQSYEDDKVAFRWRDYADGNRQKVMTLDAVEFLRRFLLHVLPDRFVRIRYFGFLANHKRRKSIARARELLAAGEPVRLRERPAWLILCPSCQAALALERSARTIASITLRSPPVRIPHDLESRP